MMLVSKQNLAAAAELLKKRAEEQAREELDVPSKSPDEIRALVHDLHVHQIELEMQNEQLRASQIDLEIAREEMAELYDFAPIGYLTINLEGKILRANLTSVSMLGVERSKLLTQKFNTFVFSADQQSFYHCVRQVFKEKHGTHTCEIRIQPVGGGVFFAQMEAMRALDGGVTTCRMTLSDITEQKRAQERLQESERNRLQYESEEWKRLALEAAELGAWDQNLLNQTLVCSGEACKMFGLPPMSTLSWEDVLQRVHPEDRPGFATEIERSTAPDGPRRIDTMFRILASGDKTRWVRLVARTSFKNEEGRLLAARRTGVLADITPLKRAEETLRVHSDKLEDLVRERTVRLRTAVAELEHLSYTLVHDLRAPLRSISGYTNLLLDQCKDLRPVHKTFLERSNAAAVRMDRLIVDALSYSQIAREHFALEWVDTFNLLRQLIDTYPQFQDQSQHITIQKPLPAVMGNQALLTQCFSNLLANALKFVAPGQPPAVRIFGEENKGNRVRIWFEDDGIGIDEEGKKKLFRMFQRLQTEYDGTGIGLALVKKAVERMNGKVGVQSKLGRGSRFWLELEKAAA